MKATKIRMLAVCGLDCSQCDIRKMTMDSEATEKIIQFYRCAGWIKDSDGEAEILDKAINCKGCRNDRSKHWSKDCFIYDCCVNQKELHSCFQCDDFTCVALTKWANKCTKHQEAIDRLKYLRTHASF